MLSTGGTTGRPESVVLAEVALVWAAREMAVACAFTERDMHVAFGPYGHASGSLFEIYMPLLAGASVLPIARWRAQSVVEAIARYGGTYCITVGTHMFDLLELPPGTEPLLRSLRLILSGAGPDHLYERVEQRFGVRVVRCYGLSECMGHAVSRLHDPYKTGDLLVEHPDGYLSWEGRIKEIVRRGGLMIDAIEPSDPLSEYPLIAEVIVVGTPDQRLGERAPIVAVRRPRTQHGGADRRALRLEVVGESLRQPHDRDLGGRVHARGRRRTGRPPAPPVRRPAPSPRHQSAPPTSPTPTRRRAGPQLPRPSQR